MAGLVGASNYDVPPLRETSFEELGWPSFVNKNDLSLSLRVAAQQLFGVGYVNLGAMSDFMHGHLLYSEDQRAIAVLFHTQENPHLRTNAAYEFHHQRLDPYLRNFLVWLMDVENYHRGDLIRAEEVRRQPAVFMPTLVSTDMLDPGIFGELAVNRQINFYFFRTLCRQLPKDLRRLQNRNLIRFDVHKKPVCLVLVNEACRSATDDEVEQLCPGKRQLDPYSTY